MNARAHTNPHTNPHTHTHTVKGNGPAMRPGSTVLYYHKTHTTLRRDDLLGEKWITAVGFNTSERSMTG